MQALVCRRELDQRGPSGVLSFLAGTGPIGDAITAFDWSETTIGRPEEWPDTLKTTVALTLSSQFPNCIFWGENLISIPNAAYLPLAGNKPNVVGHPVSEVWPEVWSDLDDIARRAMAGEATFIEDMPLTIDRGNGMEEAFFTFCYSPIRDVAGNVHGVLDTVVETTGKVRAEQKLRIANLELGHRIKNALTVFQAIANQSFAGDIPRDEVRQRLQQRLVAMGAAHDLLLNEEGEQAQVGEIVMRAVRPVLMRPESVVVAGPMVALNPRQALSLALAVHELATNALKYGALSEPEGQVHIKWEITGGAEPAFRFVWRECDGPPVSPPLRRGFGSRLVERVLASDFRGKAVLDFAADGVRFTLEAPVQGALA